MTESRHATGISATGVARRRVVTTPEGVTLPFEIAPLGSRVAAFMLDTGLVYATVIAVILIALLSVGAGSTGGETAFSIGLVATFLMRNFYFTFCEMRWGGKTLGKRVLGLRVISRDGGPLSGESILARNLTRDLETFFPLIALFSPEQFVPGAPVGTQLFGVGWVFVIALLPLFNRQRLRRGRLDRWHAGRAGAEA